MISKDEFLEWKSQSTSQLIMKLFSAKIKQGIEELSYVAGQDPGNDRQRVGKLEGLRTFTDLTYYDLEEADD